MLILLPPSETKRAGGDDAPLRRDAGSATRLDELALQSLSSQRRAVIDALVALSDDPERAATVLKLSAKRRGDIDDNRHFERSPTLPAVDRYTGVLFDALDAATLPLRARAWLGEHVLIHSAVLGPVGALDPLPVYRLAAGTSVPGLGSLRAVWAQAVTDALATTAPDLILDLRSEAYAALGPVPVGIPSAYIRVVSAEGGRALNHFNKHSKGAFVRDLAQAEVRWRTIDDAISGAAGLGWHLRPGAEGELALTDRARALPR